MSRDHHRPQNNLVFGAVIIVVGVVALLDKMGLVEAHRVLACWPLLLVLVGVMRLSRPGPRHGSLVGGGLIAFGLFLTLQNLGWLHLHLRDWWPLWLIGAGVWIASRGLRATPPAPLDSLGNPAAPATPLSADRIDTTVVFSGSQVRCDSQAFQGGEASVMMGGLELDLRRASMTGEALLRVSALWGGVKIKVPTDWSVVIQGMPLLGGLEDKTVPPMTPGKRLVIDAQVIMGGLEIGN